MAEHRCFRHFLILSASAKFLAMHFKKNIYNNPAFMVKDIQDEAKELLKINVSLYKCKRAKRMIIQELDGSYKVKFEQLEAYAAALKKKQSRYKS